jgi:polyisoprenoid-binding protein YceI
MRRQILALCAVVAGLAVLIAQPKSAQSIADKSWVAYRLVHPFHVVDATSRSVQYNVELDPARKEITKVTAQVDVTTFDSGNSNRDSHAMEVIDALTYPDVQFTGTSVVQKDDSIFVTGKLTFHGVTNDVAMAGTAQWLPNEVDVKGAFDLSLTAFKVERPALLMIPVEDKLSFTMAAAFALQ